MVRVALSCIDHVAVIWSDCCSPVAWSCGFYPLWRGLVAFIHCGMAFLAFIHCDVVLWLLSKVAE